jgi:hypothetical protein
MLDPFAGVFSDPMTEPSPGCLLKVLSPGTSVTAISLAAAAPLLKITPQ